MDSPGAYHGGIRRLVILPVKTDFKDKQLIYLQLKYTNFKHEGLIKGIEDC